MHNLIKCPPVGIISRQEQKVTTLVPDLESDKHEIKYRGY